MKMVADTPTAINSVTRLIISIFCVILPGLSSACAEDYTSCQIENLYVVSNQVQCVVIESRFHQGLPEFSIEGTKHPIFQYEEAFERWAFDLQSDQSQRAFHKYPLGILQTDNQNDAHIAWGTTLLILNWQAPGPVFKRNTAGWSWKSQKGLQLDLDQVIGFDRTYEHAVIPWHGSVAIVKMASLETEPLVVEIKTNWNIALSFGKATYHHALLSREGSRLIFFPEGSSPVGHQILVLDASGSQIIKLPDGLRWNDLLDAEVVNGQLFFVTRNSFSYNNVHQITDSSWKVLATFRVGEGWFRPVWDVDGQRLIFPQFSSLIKGADPAIRYRIWNYQTGKDITVTVK